MTGRAILDLSPQLVLAALREIGMDLPLDTLIVGAQIDPFRAGTLQLCLVGSGLPECDEGEWPLTITGRPVAHT